MICVSDNNSIESRTPELVLEMKENKAELE